MAKIYDFHTRKEIEHPLDSMLKLELLEAYMQYQETPYEKRSVEYGIKLMCRLLEVVETEEFQRLVVAELERLQNSQKNRRYLVGE